MSNGRLEAFMLDYTLPSVPLSMLIAPQRASIARVRLLVDFLADRITSLPGIEMPRPHQ